MADTLNFAPDYISHPGETLEDVLEERSMKQAELAERTGLSRKTVNEIIQGKAPITPETALHLERIFDIPAHFWNARESQYQEAKARMKEKRDFASCLDWLDRFPVRKMAELGWIEKHKDKVEQLEEMLGFFGVASPKEWRRIWMEEHSIAFRKSLAFASDPYAVAAWLRYGEKEALQRRIYQPYDEKGFKAALKEIRSVTHRRPEVFEPSMVDRCAHSGVAVVFTPQLPEARISGATQWLHSDLALIQLSLRYKTDDHFWFTFFHEAAHILLHGKRDVFLEGSEDKGEQAKEDEANKWAANFLIPQNRLHQFMAKGEKTYAAVEAFAAELGIATGIVVGQLQHKGYIPYSHLNKLKKKFQWKNAGTEK